MSSFVIYDSSIVINLIRSRSFFEQVYGSDPIIRNSSVVLAELWRGASARADRELVRWMQDNFRILTPTESNWIESGQILAKMQTDHCFEPKKLRALHFDVLIALTARAHGARLITSNRADFELIRGYREFELEVW
ncbi:MAG TPA: type II toxin-antitoxin system VapC family toxin [Terracidiphilus sp.]|jgi:predicted nucleic acid-binding protein|nr:type II toxin-antitoxin system VapC family toxin [Terracidiphilus sp.]